MKERKKAREKKRERDRATFLPHLSFFPFLLALARGKKGKMLEKSARSLPHSLIFLYFLSLHLRRCLFSFIRSFSLALRAVKEKSRKKIRLAKEEKKES